MFINLSSKLWNKKEITSQFTDRKLSNEEEKPLFKDILTYCKHTEY